MFEVHVVNDEALDPCLKKAKDYPLESQWKVVGRYETFAGAVDRADDFYYEPTPVKIIEK